MSRQLDAFPCKIVRYLPYPDQRTACARGRAVGEDGLVYIVKMNVGYEPICATEWICHSIAEFVHIPVPSCKVLQMPDGILVFGTAVLSQCLSDLEASKILFSASQGNEVVTPELAKTLSSTYSFDLFIGNADRHEANYVFSSEEVPGTPKKIARIRTIDFDAATLIRDSNSPLPLASGTNTVRVGRRVRNSHAFDLRSATALLNRLQRGRELMFERAMFGIPEEWLPENRQDALVKWAGSPIFEQRLMHIQQGLSDGTYL